MYLVEDKAKPVAAAPLGDPASMDAPGGKWNTFPNSLISHHGAACCDIAHAWLIDFDFAQRGGGDILSGPRWIREHSAWGPSVWPIHWCEAVDGKIVDCGVHAAIAHEVLIARGVRAFRAQFVQRYSDDAVASWRCNWTDRDASDHWIDGERIYHEGNAVLIGENAVKLWDGSAGCWLNPRGQRGYGSVAAVRIESEDYGPGRFFMWGERQIAANQWVAV